ncbi:MAG: TolC family protein [Deltaproteobacteria bacterium]|jgi:outer membrane protein TolC|nr:TolC family protein [Deltaproteobacteria bacterium]MBT6435981.1 TolC family protein [Deltaproteobacteria bacterium]MBT6491132.1 TolC family protein [Deltaproteobacteria bacterium]
MTWFARHAPTWLALVVAGTFLNTALAEKPKALTSDDCVRIALSQSAVLDEANARVEAIKGKLAEVESIFYPKLTGIAYIAPMYSVRGNAMDNSSIETSYSRLSDWGPYTHLQAILAQPLTTFGRAGANERAVEHLIQVEKARVRAAEHILALEVRKLYYAHLFSVSLRPALRNVIKVVKQAREHATKEYESAQGSVTQIDLTKIDYAGNEAYRYQHQSNYAATMTMAALKHTMGMPASTPIIIAEKRLPRIKSHPNLELPRLIMEASENRPEWSQLSHGEKAALAWKDAEALSSMPTLFLAGTIESDWTPMRDDSKNPYHYDPYNGLTAGIAMGLQFNFDPWHSVARANQADAKHAEVSAMRRFAETGIPLQVKQSYEDFQLQRELEELSRSSVKSARKWMTFAASAFATGTGPARDVLEGVAAYSKAKFTHYESLFNYYVAEASLYHSLGRDP